MLGVKATVAAEAVPPELTLVISEYAETTTQAGEAGVVNEGREVAVSVLPKSNATLFEVAIGVSTIEGLLHC